MLAQNTLKCSLALKSNQVLPPEIALSLPPGTRQLCRSPRWYATLEEPSEDIIDVTGVSPAYKISKSSKLYHWAESSTTVLQGLNEWHPCGLFCDIVLKEVELISASYIGLKAVVDFLYGGELMLDSGNIVYILETLEIAHLLRIWTVVDFYCEYLEQEVSKDIYLYLQELASIYNFRWLDASILGFILSHFSTLSFTPDFLQNIPCRSCACT
ncbi:Kelch-like protein 36 [Myotis brandtii]|uniref:Kelch-like protein 36 n=1 Tax=Myotis brandtii TaxID=109478 RepID=S7N815_MYOBR|nr:Kelch-like protein 36 [Myotis brandtii]